MTVQRTRHRLDTCDCIVVYTWDDALPPALRSHTGAVIERTCVDHAPLQADPVQHYLVVAGENRAISLARQAAAAAAGWSMVGDVETSPQSGPTTFAFTLSGPLGSRTVSIVPKVVVNGIGK